MIEITLTASCESCNGDGYIICDNDTWQRYLEWTKDPTEDKIKTPDNFPVLLKSLTNFIGVTFSRDVCISCPKCSGRGSIKKPLTLEDLKNLLK